jgi:hypothetical protein
MSVTATLESSFGNWKLQVNNHLGRELSGVTLTLPGAARRVSSSQVEVKAVERGSDGSTRLVTPRPDASSPATQIVLQGLKPGASTIDIEWSQGQEPR